jgi:hypothetical protein
MSGKAFLFTCDLWFLGSQQGTPVSSFADAEIKKRHSRSTVPQIKEVNVSFYLFSILDQD